MFYTELFHILPKSGSCNCLPSEKKLIGVENLEFPKRARIDEDVRQVELPHHLDEPSQESEMIEHVQERMVKKRQYVCRVGKCPVFSHVA